jgi:hypothetical protein
MGMNREDAYYEPEDEENFDDEIAELLNGDYNPDLPENIKQAILDDALFGSHWDALVDAIQKNEKTVVGLIIVSSIYEYWEARAESDCQP